MDPEDKKLVDLIASLPPSELKDGLIRTLDEVVSDGRVDEGELSLLDDRYVNPEPPSIRELSLIPSRVVNGKIYGLRLSFQAVDSETPIASATVEWIPLRYEGIPDGAFPHEDVRTLYPRPSDGGYGDRVEEFHVAITDFRGGREYEIRVEVEDEAGNRQVTTIKTPYIREYEDVAGRDGSLVGAIYYPKYDHGGGLRGCEDSPLLGVYDPRDDVVISRHIDWATGHGVDFFLVSWRGPCSYEDSTLKGHIMRSPLADSTRFAVLYEADGLGDLNPAEAGRVLRDSIDYLNETYFNDPRYLRIEGKPVLGMHVGELPESILEALSKYKEEYGLYLVGTLDRLRDRSEMARLRYFDAIALGGTPEVTGAEGDHGLGYREQRAYMMDLGIGFIPLVAPPPNNGTADGEKVRSKIEAFKERLVMALQYSRPRKVVLISSFNDWSSCNSVEPSEKNGMGYLDAVLEAVGEHERRQRELRGMVYILPSGACTDVWERRYGDRIYFYVHANLSDYRDMIERDFSVISEYYDTVIVILPADDTKLFLHNLKVISDIASEHSLRVLWGIFPKGKYGVEESYLRSGTKMNGLVIELMDYLSSLDSTWKVAVWYGWEGRQDYREILHFYHNLLEDLKERYAVWLDEEYASVLDGLATAEPGFFVVTELYSGEEIEKYSGRLGRQVVITGYEAGSAVDWLEGICPLLRSIRTAYVGIWMFYDRGDGSGESYGAYFPGEGLADPWDCMKGG